MCTHPFEFAWPLTTLLWKTSFKFVKDDIVNYNLDIYRLPSGVLNYGKINLHLLSIDDYHESKKYLYNNLEDIEDILYKILQIS